MATESPWARMASRTSALLALMRPTMSSPWAPNAPDRASDACGELIRDRVPVSLDRLDGARAAAADAADHLVGMGADGASREFGCVRKPRRHPVAVGVDRLDDRVLRGLNSRDQIVAALAQARQQVVADRLDSGCRLPRPAPGCRRRPSGWCRRGARRGCRRSRRSTTLICAPSATMRSSVVEPAPSRPRAMSSDDAPSDAASRWPVSAQALAQTRAGGIEVLGDAVVGVRDRVADPRPAGHDRLALIGHFGDQRPNPALVVGIGALERRNLRLHPGLEFGGARKRAFDPIAHRREFATDRLGQVRHMLAGHRLGLGQTHGDLRDRARRLSELAQPPRRARQRRT